MSERKRKKRDEYAASHAVHMAATHGKNPGIGVDDMARVEKMVERVVRIATEQGFESTIDKSEHGTHVHIGKNWVYVFAADQLIPPGQRPN